MDLKFLYNRVKYLILDPEKEWESIASEKRPVQYIHWNFFIPLITLIAIAAFTGSSIFNSRSLSVMYSVLAGIKFFLLYYLLIYASSVILKELTYALDLGRDFSVSYQMLAYSLSPFLVCQVISRLFESFIFVNVLALYGLYIFWIGMEKMLNPPEHKKMPLVIITAVAVTGLIIVFNILLTMVTDRVYFAFFA